MLDTFSFEPYIKSYHWFTFRSLEFSEIAFRSLSSSPVCLSLLSLTADSATPPAAALGRPGQVRLRLRFTWRPRKLLDPLSLALEPPPHATPPRRAQNFLAAATATPPWRARCTTPGRQLARAPASGEPEHSILCALSLAPRSGSPERHRRPPNAGEPQAHRRPTFFDPIRPR